MLADLLEVKHPEWANAIEGLSGNNKLSLVVSPRYARAALKIYSELDPKKYYSVAVLDTEKAASSQAAVFKNSLAEEIGVKEAFLAPYMELLLGKVIKCRSIEELSDCKIGITPECLLYHNLRLQHINPEHYTRMAYIGKAQPAKEDPAGSGRTGGDLKSRTASGSGSCGLQADIRA